MGVSAACEESRRRRKRPTYLCHRLGISLNSDDTVCTTSGYILCMHTMISKPLLYGMLRFGRRTNVIVQLRGGEPFAAAESNVGHFLF